MKQAALAVCLIIMTALCFGQQKPENPALSSLVAAERSFARTSLEVGSRAAFMKFFADDGIVFRPGPVRYKDATKGEPPPANPREISLEWEPLYADVAASGDMGYTTGPSMWTDHSPAKRTTVYGYYLSIWKKQSTEEWKVAFDIGTEQPGPYTGSRTFHAPVAVERKEPASTSNPEEHIVSLMNAEQVFFEAVQKDGAVSAIAQYAGQEARVYRENQVPIVGKDSIRSYFSVNPYLSQWSPMFCDVALAGDMGYVYGGYEVGASGAAPVENGFYLRVWKRDGTDTWKFVAEVTSPMPPAPPPPKE